MKKCTALLLTIACVSVVSSQALKVHTKNALTQTFQLMQIDSITFDLSSSVPVDPGTAQYPANVLKLTRWELTLPLEEDDPTMGSTPKDVYMPISGYSTQKDFLDTYSHPVHFLLNDAKTGVVFRAHAGGATTSGSSYPRSELREMKPGYTRQTEKASWSTTSGKHTMYIKQAVTAMTLTAKDEVVIGQIHGGSDDVTVFLLDGNKLYIKEGNSRGPCIDEDYALGEIMEVKIEASNGVITYYYNNMSTPVHTYNASDSGCYFKAGCYTQSNISKGDVASAYAEVTIYDLIVTHSN